MNKKTSKQGQSEVNQSNPKTSGASRPAVDLASQTGPKTMSEIFAIDFLEKQHIELQKLFAQAHQGTSQAVRRELLEKVATLLRNHTEIEERHFYPGVLTKDTQALLQEARKEHKEAEEQLTKLLQLEPNADSFPNEFDKLVKGVQHHIKEEENELFPRVAKDIPTSTLSQIGQEMEKSYKLMGRTDLDAEEMSERNGEE